jgi:shikimate kinase
MKKPMQPRVFLIGLRGTGKTTLARLLADKLGWPWVDADAELLQRTGQSIARLIDAEGEPAFRHYEKALLEELTTMAPVVLATGGGAVLDAENRRLLRERGLVIWLTAAPDVLAARLAADADAKEQRPSLTGLPVPVELKRHQFEREPHYRACADLTIDTSDANPETLAQQLMKDLQCMKC